MKQVWIETNFHIVIMCVIQFICTFNIIMFCVIPLDTLKKENWY